MHIPRLNVVNPSVFARRAVALAVFAGAATLGLHAEQPVVATSQPNVPFTSYLSTPAAVPFNVASVSTSTNADLGYSSSTGAEETVAAESFMNTTAATQPPPRRRYGRPRYSDGSHNPDGSNKYTFVAGAGFTLPAGNTHKYNTDSYDFQVGFGRNFNKNVALIAQFDWDNFGLQASNITTQSNYYFGATGQGLDGNTHVWSFTLNPVYNIWVSEGLGAYLVGGVGFYHKVTTFTVPTTAYACYYYCGYVTENAALDHYTSNAPGFNGGIGFTYKPSRFANEKFFLEARYVFVDNQKRYGLTAANQNTYTGFNYYPANSNHTTYIPVKIGLRF